MAIEGNSHKSKETKSPERKNRVLKPVASGSIDKNKPGLIQKWLSRDGDTIKEFIIETIVIPGLIDGVAGIGDIIIDSFTDGISRIFENMGFGSGSGRSKSNGTSYNNISKKKKYRRRDRDDYDEDDNEERSYNNVRVRTKREAENVIEELKAMIADPNYGGCATIADLYELTDNGDVVCHTDSRYGWTKLGQPTENYFVHTKHREKPWLLRLPQPKDLNNI